MYQSINFGVIGVQETDLEKKMQLAKRHGFTHMEAGADEVTACGVEKVKALLQQYGVEITCFNVPFHPVQVSEEEFASRMEALPAQAKAMSQVGCSRSIIWIIPGSDTLPYEENYALHVRRLSQVARVYGEYGIRLGLEFIGPYTARKNSKYPAGTGSQGRITGTSSPISEIRAPLSTYISTMRRRALWKSWWIPPGACPARRDGSTSSLS